MRPEYSPFARRGIALPVTRGEPFGLPRDLCEHESPLMAARFINVGLLSLHRGVTLACACLALLTSNAAGQSRPGSTRPMPPRPVPPRTAQATSPYRARLAAWQNEGQVPDQGVPGGNQPVDPNAGAQPMEVMPPEAQPMPRAQPQSRLRSGSTTQSPSTLNGQPTEDYAAASLDQWIQSDGCASCGGFGCGACCNLPNASRTCGPRCCGPGGCWNCPEDPCLSCHRNLWWVKADLMLGWRSGRGYPPLVTTDPATEDSTTAGVLPNATILYGGETVASQMQAGLNLDFGTWLNDCQTVGFGGRYFFLGDDSANFSRNNGENSILAVPFFSLDLGAPSSLLLAHPDVDGDVRSGNVSIRASNQVYGFDAYVRLLYCQTGCGRVDFITGYHTSYVNDDFRLNMRTDGNQANNDVRLFDEFNTRNSFNGVILGILTEHQACCMTIRGKARVSVGNMHQRVDITGGTSINGVLDRNEPGGLFTATSNMGGYSQDQFCAVTEAGISLGYYITPHVQATVGYNLIYWSSVVRPGDQIDTTVDDVNVPPTRPTFDFNTTSFWIQSVNLGLTCEF